VVGATMAEAADAETGLEMIAAGDYHIVLMDLRMPGMDGEEAIKLLRAREDGKTHLPIIVVTADTAIDLRDRCLQSGADEVLRKPIAMGPLLNAMGKMMAQRGAKSVTLS
jgi:CheY-like chemotaxis protein